jgi:carbonic anhydrase
MTETIQLLLDNNREWVAEQLQEDKSFFDHMAEGQHPKFLWIGCSDSRVPPDQVTKTKPG